MDSMSAFLMGMANRGRELMVFDWDRAAELIKQHNFEDAAAGLEGDWGYTGGEIFTDGKPNMDDYTYLASTWATPQIIIGGQCYSCYRMESEVPGWGSDTKWPESAIKILGLVDLVEVKENA